MEEVEVEVKAEVALGGGRGVRLQLQREATVAHVAVDRVHAAADHRRGGVDLAHELGNVGEHEGEEDGPDEHDERRVHPLGKLEGARSAGWRRAAGVGGRAGAACGGGAGARLRGPREWRGRRRWRAEIMPMSP
jgi:hypothetical protein